MKYFFLFFFIFFIFINSLFSQDNQDTLKCKIYSPEFSEETFINFIYICKNNIYFELKYGEIQKAQLLQINYNTYKILNIPQMVNQKYLDINKFKNNSYTIAINQIFLVLKIKTHNQNKIHKFIKYKGEISEFLLKN